MSQKYIGFATTLKRGNGDGPPETYTAIAGVRSVDPPKGTATIVEATTMDNPNAFKEYIAGLRDAGPITFQLATDPADTGFQHVIQDWVNGILRDWQIVLSDTGATGFSFSAFVKDFAFKAPIDGLATVDATLQISGKPTFGSFA